jgi:hypothetical protein
MEYPIFLGGRRAGTLRERAEGLYTAFEAELPEVPEQLLRLWVHGAGESAYLGIPEPGEGGLFLTRRLSAMERRHFPRAILCASEEESLHNNNPAGPEAAAPETPAGEAALDRCPWPAEVSAETGDLLWLRRSDGTLTAHDGVSSLLALPAALKSAPPGAVLRVIEGRDYLVFRY